MTTKKQTQQTNKQQVKKEEVPLSSFVSNEDSNIYAVSGLPEEFIATLFAWVSRSPKSFKEHLEEAIKEFDIKATEDNQFKELSDKAKAFHEKWTVGYGHSSVSEHAAVHVGIEDVSRKLSSDLELASTFLSITEYSQRYQQPKPGDWVNPYKTKTDREKYESLMSSVYKNFAALIKILVDAYVEDHKKKHKKNPTQREKSAYEKLAFEDARYVLPVSMHTQLGVTANARAWKDVITNLEAVGTPEYVDVATKLREEISKVTPTLLRHTKPSKYQNSLKEKIARISEEMKEKTKGVTPSKSYSKPGVLPAVLLDYPESEGALTNRLLDILVLGHTNYHKDIPAFNFKEPNTTFLITSLLNDLEFFDNPHDIFKKVSIDFKVYISEANWHQLLRHNRSAHFYPGEYTGEIVTPPMILKSEKALHLFNETIEMVDNFRKENKLPEANGYLFTNAHALRVDVTASIWSLYHLINLRTTEEAQWEIRETFNKLHDKLLTLYPNLFNQAKRR